MKTKENLESVSYDDVRIANDKYRLLETVLLCVWEVETETVYEK